jgi:hypothetical protein
MTEPQIRNIDREVGDVFNKSSQGLKYGPATVDTANREPSVIADACWKMSRMQRWEKIDLHKSQTPHSLQANKVRRVCTCTFFLAVQVLPLQDNL